VIIIAELAHALAAHPDLVGVGKFVFLFIIVWWAWLNGSLYHDLHGNNDVRTRVFTFLQMFAVAGMATFAHNAMGEGAVGFALSYGFFQLILSYLWWRTGVHDPEHRPRSTPYVRVYLISTALFLISASIPAPWQFVLWGIAVPLTLFLPMKNMKKASKDPNIDDQQVGFITPSGVERFGLFSIIVLGEVIVGVVSGLTESAHLTWDIGLIAALGMAIGFAMWWIYFDFVSNRLPIKKPLPVTTWLYLHLPKTMCIAAAGAAILNVVEHGGEHLPVEVRWLLVGTIAIALISISILMRTIQVPDEQLKLFQTGSKVTFASGILIALVGLAPIETIPLLIIVLALMMAPISYGFRVWVHYLIEQNSEKAG
jgi:low temperature requirement protein LtrA